MELIKITFKQWEKWNPRKDIKQPSWFAMSNRITEDDDIQTLSDQEFRAFVHLTCLASQKSKPPVVVNIEKAVRITGIKRATFLETIAKLESLSVITAEHVRDPNVIRTDAVRDPNATLQDKTLQDRTEHLKPAALFDFESVANKYPKPKGPNAEARFREQIRTEEDFADLNSAVENYLAMLSLPENSWRHSKQNFATFLGTKASGYFWRDFILATSRLPTPRAASQHGANSQPDPSEAILRAIRKYSGDESEAMRAELGEHLWAVYRKAGGRSRLSNLNSFEFRKAIQSAASEPQSREASA